MDNGNMKGSRRYQIVKTYRPGVLGGINQAHHADALIHKVKDHLREKGTGVILRTFDWETSRENVISPERAMDALLKVNVRFMMEVTDHNEVMVTLYGSEPFHPTMRMWIRIQPSFISKYLDRHIDEIAEQLHEQDERKRRQAAIDEVRQKLYKGER